MGGLGERLKSLPWPLVIGLAVVLVVGWGALSRSNAAASAPASAAPADPNAGASDGSAQLASAIGALQKSNTDSLSALTANLSDQQNITLSAFSALQRQEDDSRASMLDALAKLGANLGQSVQSLGASMQVARTTDNSSGNGGGGSAPASPSSGGAYTLPNIHTGGSSTVTATSLEDAQAKAAAQGWYNTGAGTFGVNSLPK